MSLQTVRQLFQELEAPTQPPPDSKRILLVLKGLMESHDHISQQARKYNQVSCGQLDWSQKRTEALNSDEATAYKQFHNVTEHLCPTGSTGRNESETEL